MYKTRTRKFLIIHPQLCNLSSSTHQLKWLLRCPLPQLSVVLQDKPPDYMEAELEVGFNMFVERCALVAEGRNNYLMLGSDASAA